MPDGAEGRIVSLGVIAPLSRPVGQGAAVVSWTYSAVPPEGQTAYEVEIGTDSGFASETVVWSSGKILSTSVSATCAGAPLKAHRLYWWRVRTWSGDILSSWTKPAQLETAKRASEDWVAAMIAPETDPGIEQRCPTVTSTFTLESVPENVRLYVSSHGLYRARLNDFRVGNDELTPGWTSYTDRLAYQTYDVTEQLRPGENRLEFILADGWYRGALVWEQGRLTGAYGTQVGVIAELRALSADEPIVASDASWRSGLSNVLFASLYHGETVDRRLPPVGPDVGGVTVKDFDRRVLVAQEAEPVRIIGELVPAAVRADSALGVTFYDFGQNIAGFVSLLLRGAPGARITVEHAEILHDDGELNRSSHNDARSRLEYTLAGVGEEEYRPSFTFMGFRHVKVTIEGQAEVLAIKAHPISSDLRVTGHLSTGNSLINRLIANADWSLKSNFIDVPTDCPQRSERLGWCGDAQVFSPTASYLRDCREFFRKWIRDLMVDQREDGAVPHVVPHPARHQQDRLPNFYGSAGWGDAVCMVPWTLYLHFGDKDALAEALPAMQRWVDFLLSLAPDGIVQPPNDILDRGFTFGDWLSPTTFQGRWLPPNAKPNPITGDDYVATCFLFGSATVVAKSAALLGDEDISEKYEAIAARVRDAFQREFITPTGRLAYESQGALILALHHQLLPDWAIVGAVERLRAAVDRTEGHIGTGVMTTSLVLPTLSRYGMKDVALRMLLKTTSPSWLYPVTRGATTIWERWDGIDLEGSPLNKMNSYNHYAYGAVLFWFYHNLAGIQYDESRPGYEHIILSPEFHPELSPVEATFHSPRGDIHSTWRWDGDEIVYEFETPVAAAATLCLAEFFPHAVLNGQRVDGAALQKGVPLDPGRHTLRVQYTHSSVSLPATLQM